MRVTKRIFYSIVFAVIVLFVSMFAEIIPCQTAPVIPNPEYSWKFCNLNPDSNLIVGVKKMYFGYTESLAQSYLITIILSFILAMGVLHLLKGRRKE